MKIHKLVIGAVCFLLVTTACSATEGAQSQSSESSASVALSSSSQQGESAYSNLASARGNEKLGFVYDRDDITPHIDGVRYFDSREYFLDLIVSNGVT